MDTAAVTMSAMSDRTTVEARFPSRYSSQLDTAEIRAIQTRVRTIFDGPLPPRDPSLAAGHCP